jgi:predicted proteasome-type protease
MTYAVAVRLQRGVVFAADTRTNAGIDNVSQFRKLHFGAGLGIGFSCCSLPETWRSPSP